MGIGSRLWKDEKFSDCTLVLKIVEPIVTVVQEGEVSPKRENSTTRLEGHDDAVKVWKLHRVFLADASEYFRTRLLRLLGTPPSSDGIQCMDGDGVLVERVAEQDVQAMEAFLQLLYTESLDEDLPPQEVLKVLKLADRFGAPRCCVYAMEKMSKQKWSVNLTESLSHDVLLLCDNFGGIPEFLALKEKAVTELLKSYGDLCKVMSDDKLRIAWCALIWPVVVAVLQDPRVKTDNEDTIVSLIDTWLAANAVDKNPAMFKLAVADMDTILRVASVSPSMLNALVKSNMLESEKALAIYQVNCTTDAVLKALLITSYQSICPAHWFNLRPTHVQPAEHMITLKVQVGAVERSYITLPESASFLSPGVYLRGHFFQIRLDVSGDSPSSSSIKLSLTHQPAAPSVLLIRKPFPVVLSIKPLASPNATEFAKPITEAGVSLTHHMSIESESIGYTDLFTRKGADGALKRKDPFWANFIAGNPLDLVVTVSIL